MKYSLSLAGKRTQNDLHVSLLKIHNWLDQNNLDLGNLGLLLLGILQITKFISDWHIFC